ncbi:MAG TPA: response regulator transcription factor [Dongiaceae bacterium]|nr:response regulator transcription factor [Dongiaceae bacterium]
MKRLLLIEDDEETAAEIVEELSARGYEVDGTLTGTGGLDKARDRSHDLIIVDRLLPGINGLALIETLRTENILTPVLVLSALGAVDERVRGLRAGGDDYLAKPFAMIELVARIEALLRRPPDTRQTILNVGPLELDLIRRTVSRRERCIELQPREFQILEFLVRYEGQVVTRGMLFEKVWRYRFIPDSNLVDVHMGRLRRKVDGPDELPMIHSVRGAGFILNAPTS